MSNAIDTWFAKNEKDFETDCTKIIHLLTAPKPTTEEEALAHSSALTGYENKYGSEVVECIADIIDEMENHVLEQVAGGNLELDEDE
jgi:hypothetical protein